jgi:serine/threonine-protein kinase
MTDSLVAPSELVAGKYRLTRLLGRGGMGSVWEGVHVSLGTRVACKFIEAEYAGSKEARDRFENEARAAAALRSKHVVEVYDHGVTADGRPYIVMEFLQGEPLDNRIERRGALTVPETARILQQVARALSKAHAQGIVHRDLKPENVFLVWDDEDQADIAKVVDFGIAKFTDESLGISSQTRTGSILGTPFYMSPEQARGLRTLDARSDLWSLGVIAYQCMTGQLPFGGEALGDLLVKICTGDPAPPSSLRAELGPEVDAWVRKALAREPEHRFQSAREMTDALLAIAGEPVRSTEPSTFTDVRAARSGGVPAGELSSTAGALTNAALTRTTGAGGSARAHRGLVFGGIAALVVLLGATAAGVAMLGGGEEDVSAEPAAAARPEASSPTEGAPAADPPVPAAPAAPADAAPADVAPAPPPAAPTPAVPNGTEPPAKEASAAPSSKAPAPAVPAPSTSPKTTRPRTPAPEPRKEPPPPPPPPPPPRKTGPVDLGY